jgi:hypothetical protein
MKKYHILMGDIVASRKYRGDVLLRDFKSLVSSCNADLASDILSPYTITLGDEFQGIPNSLNSALASIFYLEEMSREKGLNFKLRYVLHYGEIKTPLNRQIAYEMTGAGLTKARRMLNEKKRGLPRFRFDLKNRMLTNQLNRLFSVLDALTSEWQQKDYSLINDMLKQENNEAVGIKHGKNRTQIWKRRKRLRINEYKTLRDVIFNFIEVY